MEYLSKHILLYLLYLVSNHVNFTYLQMLEERAKLPVAHSHDDILAAIEQNSVTIIRGETGSGKTTQV